MAVMSLLKTNTLILTTNVAAVHQWIEELLDKTELTEDQIAEYTGDSKCVAPGYGCHVSDFNLAARQAFRVPAL
ncbi:hypothetical protein MASR2M78_14460 [Treponema sp.]